MRIIGLIYELFRNNKKKEVTIRRKGIRVGREKESVEVAEKKENSKTEFNREIVEQPSIQGNGGVLTL